MEFALEMNPAEMARQGLQGTGLWGKPLSAGQRLTTLAWLGSGSIAKGGLGLAKFGGAKFVGIMGAVGSHRSIFTFLNKPRNARDLDNWMKAGGIVSSDLARNITYTDRLGRSVKYVDGFPDFRPYLYKGGENEVSILMTRNRSWDEIAANFAAGYSETPAGYIWHHHEDGGTMQLVEREIHELFTHIGGHSLGR